MKRLAVFLAGLLVLVGAFVILAPRLVSIEGVRRSLAHEIAGWSGRALTFDGTPTIAFTPYLTVTFPHVVIGSQTGLEPLVVMDALSAEIPILPLIFQGQLEPSAFDFRKPVFHFAVDASGTPNWTLPEGLDATSRVGRLTVIDGTIGYDDQLGRKVDISGINLVLRWPGPTKTASIKGSATWNDERTSFSGSVGALSDLVAGQQAALRLSIDSPSLQASFGGTVQNLDGWRSSGDLSISTPSIRHVADLFGWPMKTGATLGAASVKSPADFVHGMLSLGDATVVLDGNAGEGALALDLRAPRPALQGTLAFDTLDLSAYAEGIAAAIELARATPDQPLDWPTLDQIDVDLRLSADALKVGTRRFGRTAASAALRDGRLDVAVGEMQLYGGRLSANVSASMSDGSPEGTLQARIDQVDIGDTMADLAHVSRLDGKASITLNLTARGETWNGLSRSLAGTASVKVADGKVTGVNLDTLAAAMTGSRTVPVGLMSGQTLFATSTGDFVLEANQIATTAAKLEASGYHVLLSGSAPIGRSGLDLQGEVVLDQPTGKARARTRLPFSITGSWMAPVVTPDFDALSRRSGALVAPHENAIQRFAHELFYPVR